MKPIKVKNLQQVNPARYQEGDVFYTDRQIAIRHNGKIEPLVKQSDLKEYVKKKEVQKMITDAFKKEGND